jgi:hypothetical protein
MLMTWLALIKILYSGNLEIIVFDLLKRIEKDILIFLLSVIGAQDDSSVAEEIDNEQFLRV